MQSNKNVFFSLPSTFSTSPAVKKLLGVNFWNLKEHTWDELLLSMNQARNLVHSNDDKKLLFQLIINIQAIINTYFLFLSGLNEDDKADKIKSVYGKGIKGYLSEHFNEEMKSDENTFRHIYNGSVQ